MANKRISEDRETKAMSERRTPEQILAFTLPTMVVLFTVILATSGVMCNRQANDCIKKCAEIENRDQMNDCASKCTTGSGTSK